MTTRDNETLKVLLFYEWLERQERRAFKVGAADDLMTASISHAQRLCRHYLKHLPGPYI